VTRKAERLYVVRLRRFAHDPCRTVADDIGTPGYEEPVIRFVAGVKRLLDNSGRIPRSGGVNRQRRGMVAATFVTFSMFGNLENQGLKRVKAREVILALRRLVAAWGTRLSDG
jgi:hypothetical protein